MDDLESILWPIKRQSRQILDTIMDAGLVWTNANARNAEERFLNPRAEHEVETILKLGLQHEAIVRSVGCLRLAYDQMRIAGEESALTRKLCEEAKIELSVARDQAVNAESMADVSAEKTNWAQNAINQANRS